jgi:hypothetical protein
MKARIYVMKRWFDRGRKVAALMGEVRPHWYVARSAVASVVGFGCGCVPTYLLMLNDRELAATLHGHLLPDDLTRGCCVAAMLLLAWLSSWGLNELDLFGFGLRQLWWRLWYRWPRDSGDDEFTT